VDAVDLDEPVRPADLRLVPAALAAWAVALVAIGLGPVAGGCLTALAAVVALLAWRRGWVPQVIAVAGCVAAAGLVVTAQVTLVAVHPLLAGAERGAAATVGAVVADDPRPIRSTPGAGPTGPARVLVEATLRWAEVGADRWTVGGRVLLIAPAAGWAGLLPGQEVRAAGSLAPADAGELVAAVLRVRGPPAEVTDPPWWQRAAGGLRAGLRDAATAALSPGPGGLLPGLAVGDRTGLTTEVEDDFRTAGMTHLLAVSGANLAIVGGAVLALLRLFRVDPRWSVVVSAAAVVGFVILARPSPSVLRAAVMGGIALLALGLGRGRSALPALAAAVLLLVLVDPALAVDPGFALSVLATAALVLLAPGWSTGLRRRRVPRWIAEALAVPAAAFLVTAPVVAGLNGTINPLTVPANLLAVPAVAPATILGVLAALLSPIGGAPAQACAWLAGPAVGWLVTVADRTAAVPGAVLGWPDGVVGGLLLAGLLALLLVLARSRRWRALMVATGLGLAVVLVPTRLAPPGWPPTGWAVVACDVGQGDAIVLATGTPGWVVLVDAGPLDGLVDACLSRLGVRGISLVVLSHLHADHVGGLAGALRGRPTGGVAVGPVREPHPALLDVQRAARDAGAPLLALVAGQRLHWPGLTLDVLGPEHPATDVDPDDGTEVNDGSLVLRASTPAGRVLLAGDVELAAQADLLASGVDLAADVLKMPHHGSSHSLDAFFAAVRPRAVLVSVGAGNSYGHPDVGLLDRLTRAGATVRRTDTSGDVAVVPRPVAEAGAPGRPQLTVVGRGDPLPAPSRSGRRRPRRSSRPARKVAPRPRRAARPAPRPPPRQPFGDVGCRAGTGRSGPVGCGWAGLPVVAVRVRAARVRGRGPRGPPGPLGWWPGRWRWGRPRRTPRPGS
jgi:competence protein ComEC